MAERVIGANVFTEQPKKHRFVRGSGWRTVRVWHGPNALAEAKEQDILDTLHPDSIDTVKGQPCIIEAEFPDVGGTSENADLRAVSELKWSLHWEVIDTDIHAHGKFNLSGFTPGVMEQIDTELRKGKATLTTWDDTWNMNKYAQCRVRGYNSYPEYRPIVRATIITNSNSLLKAGQAPIDTGSHPGQFISWVEIRVGTSSVVTHARFAQPYLHTVDTDSSGGPWINKLFDMWQVLPYDVDYSRSSKRYEIRFEWRGIIKASKILYDLTAGQIAAGYGSDP